MTFGHSFFFSVLIILLSSTSLILFKYQKKRTVKIQQFQMEQFPLDRRQNDEEISLDDTSDVVFSK